jgi:signal peptidase I
MKSISSFHKIVTSVLAGVVVTVFLGVAHVISVHAITVNTSQLNLGTDCSISQSASFTGMLPVPIDTYNIYVRLPSRGQTTTVQVFGEQNDGLDQCSSIGSVEASGDSWTLVGTWKQTDNQADQTIFDLATNGLSNELDANRPSIMLISKTNPTCVPTTDCDVTVNGEVGAVQPIGTLPNEDSLHIVRPIDPTTDKIVSVTYYVDNEPVYTTPTLQPFDLRYVTDQDQSLSRVILYQSSQRVVLSESVPDTFQDNFWNFLFRIFQSNPKVILTILIVIGASILGAIGLGIIHTIQKRRIWRLDHGFLTENYGLITDADRQKAFLREHKLSIIKRCVQGFFGVAGLIVAILLINTYIIQLYKVDGHSMESTYHNGSEQLINIVPVTLAHFAGHDYTPARGQVVIIRQVFGITDDIQSADKEDQYLIKRVIGLPGDRVVVQAGVITIYNAQNPNGFNPDAGSSWQKTGHADPNGPDVDVTLAKDEIFICGDNRPESIDSRFNGPILTKQIIGLVI